ncbi:hypothetical protein SY28_09045 [Meiothermus taiwanensis]|nr:hypothetical protein SY28_09045 [Meiothermus taiwanensis]KZK15068.1 hypothetical protein A3962_11720 [Meiothermus taiwanensis]
MAVEHREVSMSINNNRNRRTYYLNQEVQVWLLERILELRRRGITADNSAIFRAIANHFLQMRDSDPDAYQRLLERIKRTKRTSREKISFYVKTPHVLLPLDIRRDLLLMGTDTEQSTIVQGLFDAIAERFEQDEKFRESFFQAVLEEIPELDGRGRRQRVTEPLPEA